MRVLIADKFEPSGIDGLKDLGCEVLYEPDLTDQALADVIATKAVEVLVVRSTKVTAAMMAPGLKLVVRAGSGFNTIDVTAAAAHGVQVANCPGKNAIAVAELTFALILALDRRIPDNVADLRAGVWNKKEYSKARGLHGQTLGVLGIGNIACEVIGRAAAFGMHVVFWSRRFNGQNRRLAMSEAYELGVEQFVRKVRISIAPTPADVAAQCDVLTVHLALAPETKGIVDAGVIGRLKPGAAFVNTSRGEMVDEQALAAAIREKQVRAGLDVFASEPAASTGTFDDPIVKEPGVYGTHHIGASTDQAQEAIAAETVRIVKEFRETGTAPNLVKG